MEWLVSWIELLGDLSFVDDLLSLGNERLFAASNPAMPFNNERQPIAPTNRF